MVSRSRSLLSGALKPKKFVTSHDDDDLWNPTIQRRLTRLSERNNMGNVVLKYNDMAKVMSRTEVPLNSAEETRLDFEMKQFEGGLANAKEEADAICSGNPATMMPITMVTIMAGIPKRYGNKFRANRLRYCLRHGMRYCEYSKQLDPSRSFEWSKLLAIRGMFSIGHKLVAWIDPDAAIMDMTRSLPYIVAHYPKKDVIIPTRQDVCRGCANPYAPLDDGVLVMRNTDFSNSMLESLYADNKSSTSLIDRGAGKGAMTDFRSSDRKSWRRHVAVVPWKMLNSYHWHFGAGDFIMHWDDQKAGWYQVLAEYLDDTGAPPQGRKLLELFPPNLVPGTVRQ